MCMLLYVELFIINKRLSKMKKCYIEDYGTDDTETGKDMASLGKSLLAGSAKVKHHDCAMFFSCIDGELRGHDIDMAQHDPFEDGQFKDAILAYYGELERFVSFMNDLKLAGVELVVVNVKKTHKLTHEECQSWVANKAA